MANKVIFSGNLGADPETRTVNETTVTTVRIADTRRWKNKAGEKQEKTEWMNVNFWGASGEVIAKFFTKGSWIYTEGRLETRKWQDKDGNDRWTTEVRGLEWEFGPKVGDGGSKSEDYGKADSSPPAGGGMDDDIPF